ncbi:MAG TPA: hypothetical protein VFB60_26020 [Ktedonobacteraceae bacterium]|nr:hypothetical protein [Ktedonobacteraceae bacterium]
MNWRPSDTMALSPWQVVTEGEQTMVVLPLFIVKGSVQLSVQQRIVDTPIEQFVIRCLLDLAPCTTRQMVLFLKLRNPSFVNTILEQLHAQQYITYQPLKGEKKDKLWQVKNRKGLLQIYQKGGKTTEKSMGLPFVIEWQHNIFLPETIDPAQWPEAQHITPPPLDEIELDSDRAQLWAEEQLKHIAEGSISWQQTKFKRAWSAQLRVLIEQNGTRPLTWHIQSEGKVAIADQRLVAQTFNIQDVLEKFTLTMQQHKKGSHQSVQQEVTTLFQFHNHLTHTYRINLLISSFADRSLRLRLLFLMSKAFARTRYWQQAQEFISLLPQTSVRKIEALEYFVEAAVQAGANEQALNACKQIEASLSKITYSAGYARLWTIMAYCYALIDQRGHAQEIIDQIEQNDLEKASFYFRYGAVLWSRQRREIAEKVWQKGMTLLAPLPYTAEKDEVLYIFCKALAQAQQWERARQLIAQIVQVERKVSALSKLGELLLLDQQAEAAESCWQQAEEMLKDAATTQQQDLMRRALSSAYSNARQWSRAELALQQIERAGLRIRAHSELAGSLWLAGQKERAEQIWQELEQELIAMPATHEGLLLYLELIRGMGDAQSWSHVETQLKTISRRAGQIWTELLQTSDPTHEEPFEEAELHSLQLLWQQG